MSFVRVGYTHIGTQFTICDAAYEPNSVEQRNSRYRRSRYQFSLFCGFYFGTKTRKLHCNIGLTEYIANIFITRPF